MAAKPPGKHAVAVIFVTVFLDMAGFGLVMPVLPNVIRAITGLDLAAASLFGGWLFFSYGAMQFLFGPMIGNLSDAFGRRPVILFSLAGLAIDYLLTAFAPAMSWLFAGRLVAGFCGASYATANAYLADITAPEERGRVFGYMGAAFGLGFIIGPAIGGMVAQFGDRVPFFVAAGLALANALYGYVALPETLPPEKRRRFDWRRANPLGALRIFRAYKGVLGWSAVLFVFHLAGAVYPTIWPFWAMQHFGWSASAVGLSLAIYGTISAIVQAGLTGPAIARFGEWRAAIFGMLMAAIGSAMFGFAGGLASLTVMLVIHAPEGLVLPSMAALMSKEVPENAQGELQGGIASLQSVGMLAGTVMFTQVFGYFMQPDAFVVSPNAAFFLAAGLAAVALAIFLMQARIPHPSNG